MPRDYNSTSTVIEDFSDQNSDASRDGVNQFDGFSSDELDLAFLLDPAFLCEDDPEPENEESEDCVYGQAAGLRANDTTHTFRLPARPSLLKCEVFGNNVIRYSLPGEESVWVPVSCDRCGPCLLWWVQTRAAKYAAGTTGDVEQTVIIVAGFEDPAAVRKYTGLSCHGNRLDAPRVSIVRLVDGCWMAVLVYAGIMSEKRRRKTCTHAAGLGLQATVDVRHVSADEFAEFVMARKVIYFDDDGEMIKDVADHDPFLDGELRHVETVRFTGAWPELDKLPLDHIMGKTDFHDVDDPEVPEEAREVACIPEEVARDLKILRDAWLDAPIGPGPFSKWEEVALQHWQTVRDEIDYKYSERWMAEFHESGLPALRKAVCEGRGPSLNDGRVWGWWRGPRATVEATAAYWRGNLPWREMYAPVLEKLGLVSILQPVAEEEYQESADGHEDTVREASINPVSGPSADVPLQYLDPPGGWRIEDVLLESPADSSVFATAA